VSRLTSLIEKWDSVPPWPRKKIPRIRSPIHLTRKQKPLGVVVYACNSNQHSGGWIRKIMSSRPFWATEWICGQPGLYSESQSQETNKKPQNKNLPNKILDMRNFQGRWTVSGCLCLSGARAIQEEVCKDCYPLGYGEIWGECKIVQMRMKEVTVVEPLLVVRHRIRHLMYVRCICMCV
jgi:hypothetical protein